MLSKNKYRDLISRPDVLSLELFKDGMIGYATITVLDKRHFPFHFSASCANVEDAFNQVAYEAERFLAAA